MDLRDYNILFFGFIFWSLLVSSVFGSSFDLSQLQWTLKNQNGTIHIPAAGPPSQAHLDLLNAGIITEPLLGINDFTQRWIVEENWTYTADISPFLRTLDPAVPQTTLLVFYGIDTVANISIGDHPIAWVNNEFRHHIFDITPLIVSLTANSSDNNLTVSFESAWRYGLNVSTRSDAEDFPGGSWFEYPIAYRWTRKTASDFGWDWGPAFVPSGIHKRAYFVSLSSKELTAFPPSNDDILQTQDLLNIKKSENTIPNAPPSRPKTGILGMSDKVFVEELSVDIYKAGQSFSVPPVQDADWAVNVTLALRSGQKLPPGLLTLSLPELNATSTPFPVPGIPVSSKAPYWISVLWIIPDALPQRWYPHNLGTPKLYNLSINLDIPKSKDELHPQLNILNFTTTTGFRTIELIQSPYSRGDVEGRGITPGDQWHFEVNGKAFYSLGTNIIPFDPFYARITTDKVRWILESAVRSGQNMVRVWGGGAYQPSSADIAGGGYDFYSICDELGILAWSELIFSDTMYGINDFMLETIEPEVRQNVRRINRHPSNAQWAGGNEIEGIAVFDNNSFPGGHHYFNEFVTLFQDFLHDIVVSETKSVPYTDCSTTKGVLSLDPYVLRFNNGTAGEIYGNTERFNYDASQAFDYSTYPQARFVNEFGFHSMPSFYSWEEVLTSPDDFSFNSTVVMSRDHHPPAGDLTFPNPNAHEGQAEMTIAVETWLPTPSTPNNTNHTFAQWCWSTQVVQAMTIVSQIAWYRRGAGSAENNLGALVWQLNDVWQGVSWSSIEYSGRWKVLQYGLTGAFSPILIYPFWTPANETLQVVVVSDRWEEVRGTAQLTWYDWFGKSLTTSKHDFVVPSLNNTLVLESVGLNSILPAGKNANEVWLLLNATAELEDGRIVTSEQFFTPTSLANAALVDPKITVTRTHNLTFTLSARGGVAPWTWIDHPAGTVGVFVDNSTRVAMNGFYLVPGIDRTVTFLPNQALSRTESDPKDFVVRTLWDNTHERSST